MNKFLATVILASAPGLCMGADITDQITWYSGQYSSKQPIVNMTVNSLSLLNGVFEAPGTQFQMNGDSYKAVITGPDNYSVTRTISQAQLYNSVTGNVDPQPAFKFDAASYPVTAKTPGEYTVTIPQGAFSVNGAANDEFSVVFTVKDNRTYQPIDLGLTVSPDPVVETSDLREVLLTFNNLDDNDRKLYMDLGASPTVKPTISKLGGSETVECGFAGTSVSSGKLAYKVTIPDGAIDGPGKYKISIPEGAMRLASQSSAVYYTNTAVSFTYTYTGTGSQDVDLASSLKWYYGTAYDRKLPVDGTIQGMSMLYGLLEDGQMLRVKSGRPTATLSGPEGYYKEPEITQCRAYDYVSGDLMDINGFQVNGMLNGNTSVTVPGEYTLSIPQGALTVNGYDNAAFTVKFTVKDSRTYVPTDFNFDVRPLPTDPEVVALTYFQIFLKNTDDEGKRIYRPLGVKNGATATIAKAGGETVELTFKGNEMATTDNIGYKILFQDGLAFKNGIYTVTIPEGSMLIGSETSNAYYTNKELKYVYKFQGGGSDHNYTTTLPTVRPAQGSVKGLAGVQLETPDDALEMILSDNVTKFELTLPNGDKTAYDVLTYPANTLMNIPFYMTYTTPGQYKLTVPRDAMKYVDSNSGAEYYTSGFELVFDVTGGESVDMEYSLSTQTGAIDNERTDVYNMDYVFLNFAEDISPVEMIYTKLVYPDGSVHYARTTWSSGAKRFMINILDLYPKQYGTYKVSVPAGICYNGNGQFNKAIDFELNFMDRNMVDINCTVDPESGSTVSSLNTITLFAPADFKEIYPTNGGITMTYFYNDEDPEHRTMYYLKTVNETTMSITLDNEVKEIGDYTWSIPADAVRGVRNDGTQVVGNAMAFFWSIRESGIVNPVGDRADTLYTVYTLDGTLVMDKVKADALNRLGKGVYVINGRTYILR